MRRSSLYFSALVAIIFFAGAALLYRQYLGTRPSAEGHTKLASADSLSIPGTLQNRTRPDGTVVPATSSPPLTTYASAKDLQTFLDRLSERGDTAELALAQAKAAAECVRFKVDPDYLNKIVQTRKLLQAKNLPQVEYYAAQAKERCATYATRHDLSQDEVSRRYSAAAAKGNAEAAAHVLVENTLSDLAVNGQQGNDIRLLRSKVLDIVRSHDAAGIFELSDLFNENSALSGVASANAYAAAAWKLVACDLGMDCSSNLLRSFCLNGAVYCGSGDLRNNMAQEQFSPADYQRVVELEVIILSALQSNTAEGLFDNN